MDRICDFTMEDGVLIKYTGNDTAVCIPDGVTEIGFMAFYRCTELRSVQIPDSVIKISHSAFEGCTALTEIHIPDSVTSIDSRTFKNCTSLVEVNIPDSVTEICEHAFSGCSALTGIRIPDSVTRIGQAAFFDCRALTDIAIPESVTKIDNVVFHGCSSLTSIHIPKTVREIRPSAFQRTNVKSIHVDPDTPFYHSSGNCLIHTSGKQVLTLCENSVIPSDGTVTSLADRVFWGLPKEFSATELPDAIRDIQQAFVFSKVQSVVVPRGVTQLKYGAFLKCESLEKVVIPASVTEIGQAAFEGCPKISHLEIFGTPKISTQSFVHMQLTHFIAPDLVAVNGFSWWKERFGEQNTYLAAFENFNTESKIAKYAKKCYEDAFSALLSRDRADLLPAFLSLWKKMDSDVFHALHKMAKQAKKAEILIYLEDWSMQNVTQKAAAAPKKANSSKVATSEQKNFELSRGVLKQYKGRAGEVVIPETVTKIGEKAFRDCRKVKKVIMHDGVTKIETAAFFGCSSLTEITIGNGVTQIAKAAFWDCKALRRIVIPATVTNIGACVFEGCDSLTIVGYAKSKAEKYAKENGIVFECINAK